MVVNTSGYEFVEPVYSSVLEIYSSEERNMIVVEKFIRSLIEKYWKHTVYTDDGTWYDEALFIFTIRKEFDGTSKSILQR